MNQADDPHLLERIARLAVFHDLPLPVVVHMSVAASELQRRPADQVYAEIERRIRHLRSGGSPVTRPRLRLVGG